MSRTAVSARRRRTRRGILDFRNRSAIRPAAVSRSGSAALPLHRRDARAASSTELRCCRLNGLVSVANAPSASSLSARSASWPVMTITGTWGWISHSCAKTTSPEVSGKLRSRSTTSGADAETSSSAAAPVDASSGVWPEPRRNSRSSEARGSLSSTTNTRAAWHVIVATGSRILGCRRRCQPGKA
jgi:hypothetical protein